MLQGGLGGGADRLGLAVSRVAQGAGQMGEVGVLECRHSGGWLITQLSRQLSQAFLLHVAKASEGGSDWPPRQTFGPQPWPPGRAEARLPAHALSG